MLAHVPTWVYGLFALLLAMGLLFTRAGAVHTNSHSSATLPA